MNKSAQTKPYFSQPLPDNAVLIVGAGHFGRRAVKILSGRSKAPIYVVDKDRSQLESVSNALVETIVDDGVRFLARQFSRLSPATIIVPAVPVHLAFEWLAITLSDRFRIKQIPVPEDIRPSLPHTWQTADGSLLVSYADFRCPDDCPEPADYCTVTGKKRGKPLFQLLREIKIANFGVHVIRSRQLAPGLGGYRVDILREMVTKIESQRLEHWLVGTACKCHGTLSAMEIQGGLKGDKGGDDIS
jgi:hypothetical protein